ncbi:conserved Plasmodium protein, unknown function [Plasmodium yoelii]|uniref:Uncharacterized protein n=1 Tax=Plasmodium yoelii TaxID=5861 RepID=A0A078KEK6_PLAYE|nr:conserved Plasmodium protein, unknown function [Plasmodium yoelii]CDU84863.1 conserved Plasmodium protein, unknown function [Plasmodium yoelii]VTZ78759.1 conserved Plasmodium protein, unknown function [Plasmodium yoelii]|eukprot:XP_022813238.1 conserved Plasmodium protein, unknown function [Plasmodium yoelii]
MKLKLIKIVSCLFFICNIQAYVLNKSLKIFPKSRWTKNRNVNSLFLKINNTINFKNRGELKKEIIAHSKKMSLDLNDEQIKSIENKLNEFFSYMKWTNIRINLGKKKFKHKLKRLSLREKEGINEEFFTENMNKEGNYFVVSSKNYSQ